jgi:hypothetical protein
LNEQKLLDAIFVYKTRSEIMNFLEWNYKKVDNVLFNVLKKAKYFSNV